MSSTVTEASLETSVKVAERPAMVTSSSLADLIGILVILTVYDVGGLLRTGTLQPAAPVHDICTSESKNVIGHDVTPGTISKYCPG
jgi:hypothetical protein